MNIEYKFAISIHGLHLVPLTIKHSICYEAFYLKRNKLYIFQYHNNEFMEISIDEAANTKYLLIKEFLFSIIIDSILN